MIEPPSNFEFWLLKQARKTPRPKLFYSAWYAIFKDVRYKDHPKYREMHDHIRHAYLTSKNIDRNLLSPELYTKIELDHTAYLATTKKPSSGIKYGKQQLQALDAIAKWLKDPDGKQKFILFGSAGTGKTTLAKEVAKWQNTVAVAFTGMAAMQLTLKGLPAQTVHSYIYIPDQNQMTGSVDYIPSVPMTLPELIILDEAGMLGKDDDKVLTDIGARMLVMGDPYQLPAVGQPSPYDNAKPDFELTEIHRQALDNPILYIANELKNKRMPKFGKYGGSHVIRVSQAEKKSDYILRRFQGENKIIAGRNKTRRAMNASARELLGFTGSFPNQGETLICLRNESTNGLINGQLWKVLDVTPPFMHTCQYLWYNKRTGEKEFVDSVWGKHDHVPDFMLDKPVQVEAIALRLEAMNTGKEYALTREVIVATAFFMGTQDSLHWKQLNGVSHFDYGYCLTGHKAQGSTFHDVFVYDESSIFEEPYRWLYSAATRPSNNLIIATP